MIRPIPFRPRMVHAIIDGAKTQTRRLVKGSAPPCCVGDILWIKEAWRTLAKHDDVLPRDLFGGTPIRYEADWIGTHPHEEPSEAWGRYRHARYLPRDHSRRQTLRVVEVRTQVLREITEDEAQAEGAVHWAENLGRRSKSARRAFRDLWEDVHGEGAWTRTARSLVWVLVFETLDKDPGRQQKLPFNGAT